MSKSLGNVVDPMEAAERCGVDPLRLYLGRKCPTAATAISRWERLDEKYNADLANNLGNLVSRVAAMTERYRGGGSARRSASERLAGVARTRGRATIARAMDGFALHDGVAAAFRIVDAANLFIAETQPWALAKDDAKARAAHRCWRMRQKPCASRPCCCCR